MFKLGFHLWKSKKFSNILLTVLIALSIFMAHFCVGIVNDRLSLFDTVRNFDKEQTYYYMCNTLDNIERAAFDEEEKTGVHTQIPTFKEYMSQMTNGNPPDISYIYSGAAFSAEDMSEGYGGGVIYIATDNDTSRKLNIGTLSDGQWFTDAPHKDGYINAVVLEGKYHTGDTFTVALDNGNSETFDTMNILVTGVLPDDSHMLAPDTSGTGLGLNEIFPKTHSSVENGLYSVIYFSSEDEAVTSHKDNLTMSYSCFLTLDPHAENHQTIQNLKKFGWLLSFDEIYQATYTYIYEQISRIFPLLLGVFMMTVVCLVCVMTLNSTDYMKTYSIYYLCGMNLSDMKKILFSYSLIIMLSSGILFTVLFTLATFNKNFSEILIINQYNLYVLSGIVVLLIAVMVFVPYLMLTRYSPKQALTEN